MVVSPKNPGLHRHWAMLDERVLALELGGQGLACPFRHQTDVLQGEQGPPATFHKKGQSSVADIISSNT